MNKRAHREAIILESMIVAALFYTSNLRGRTVFETTHAIVDVMRFNGVWALTSAQADDVAKEIAHRLGV